MAKIIVTGVDSSQTALGAAEKAAVLAEGFGAELHVVSAFSTSGADSYDAAARRENPGQSRLQSLADGLGDAAQQVAESVAAVLRDSHPGLTIESSAGRGSPAEVIVRTAENVDADLIVVGNKRVQGISRILGSVARKVASEATCDIHIVNTTGR